MSNFLTKDDFLIFMAHNYFRCADSGDPYIIHSVGDRVRMREAGILTAHEQPAWSFVEPAPGQYDWGYIDGLIERNHQAGMKSLIQLYGWRMPKWMPNSWFPKKVDGTVLPETISLWNEEGQQHADQYYRAVIEHYKNNKEVMFFFGEFQGGEGIYPPFWCFYDDLALADYHRKFGTSATPVADTADTLGWFDDKCLEILIRRAKIFYDAYGEIWNCQQFLMNKWTRAFGNNSHPRAMAKFRELWPDAHIVFLQYTYFDEAHGPDCVQYVDDIVKACQCEVIVEAMFAKGLPTTTPKAIAKGFRGQILHPSGSFSFSGEPLDEWMLVNIRNSVAQWKADYEHRNNPQPESTQENSEKEQEK